MAPEPPLIDVEVWGYNYFNYFTEIEEHFQKARGTGLFLVSPLDWALIESWKNTGIPLEAVLRGIDAAFEKWRSRKSRIQKVNSLTYCSQAVMAEAQAMAGVAQPTGRKQAAPPFEIDELRDYLRKNAASLRALNQPVYSEIASALDRFLAEAETHYHDLEQLEQHLTGLEDKMVALAKSVESEEDLFAARRELEMQLRPYRGKMSAEQIAMLEKQYLDRRLLEARGLPRLSLFYMR